MLKDRIENFHRVGTLSGYLLLALASQGCSTKSTPDNREYQMPLSIGSIDLGDVKAGGSREISCEYLNTSAVDVEVVAITTSCPCLKVTPSRAALRSGRSAALRFLVDTEEEPDFRGRLRVAVEGKSPAGVLNFRTHVDLNVVD